MQHLYSLRQIRAPTAASDENPLPLPSTAKARRFISNNISHAIRRTAGGTLSPELAKKLAQLIKMEKNTLRSMENVSKERADGARQLSAWGEDQEDDVSDISDKLSVLLFEVGDLEDQYVDRHDQYRIALKDIRNIEKVVQPLRDKQQKLIEQIVKLRSQDAESAQITPLEQELTRVEAEVMVAEAQLVNITREKLKGGFNYQFDAMREFGEKLAIIAGYGKHLLQLIEDPNNVPGETRPAYNSYEASTAIVKECDRSLTTWVGSNAAVATPLSTRVQSMLEEDKVDKVHEGMRARTNTRRWSSDSESGDSPTIIKQVDVIAA